MDKFVVKRDSWHLRAYAVYRAIVKPDDYEFIDDLEKMIDKTIYTDRWNSVSTFRDFCTYWRRVLFWPAVNVLFNVGLVVMLFFLISKLDTNGGASFLTIFGMVLGMILIAAVFIATVAGIVIGGSKLIDNIRLSDDNIFVKIVDAHKKKYCSMVELEGKEDDASSRW